MVITEEFGDTTSHMNTEKIFGEARHYLKAKYKYDDENGDFAFWRTIIGDTVSIPGSNISGER